MKEHSKSAYTLTFERGIVDKDYNITHITSSDWGWNQSPLHTSKCPTNYIEGITPETLSAIPIDVFHTGENLGKKLTILD